MTLKDVSTRELRAEVKRRENDILADQYLTEVEEVHGEVSGEDNFDYYRYGYKFEGIGVTLLSLKSWETDVAKAIVKLGDEVKPGLIQYQDCSYSDPYESNKWIEVYTAIPSQEKSVVRAYMADLKKLMPKLKLKFTRKVSEEY
jgi:hypothetical protein